MRGEYKMGIWCVRAMGCSREACLSLIPTYDGVTRMHVPPS